MKQTNPFKNDISSCLISSFKLNMKNMLKNKIYLLMSTNKNISNSVITKINQNKHMFI